MSDAGQVGHYQLLALIGQGGMARVYRARDLHLEREVAVKVLTHPGVSTPKGAARFRREARLAAALRHPNLVTVHDCSPPDSPVCYLVTELVSGGDLRQEVGQPLIGEEAALLLLPVARALAAAHAAGIVHRDVKPDNILFDRAGDRATIKLTDFGVAVQDAAPRVTTDGSVSGSVIYMAPEQLREGAASAASDVWSLGITLCELIAGKAPHEGLPLGQIISRLTEGQVPLPQEGLSPELRELLSRCLAPDPARRYPDGSALAAALEQLLAAAGISQPDQELQQRMANPAGYRAALAWRLSEALVEQATHADLAARAELLDRALELVPDHAGALALLGGPRRPAPPSWRRRLRYGAAGLVLLLGLAGALLLAWRSADQRQPATSPPLPRASSRQPAATSTETDAAPALKVEASAAADPEPPARSAATAKRRAPDASSASRPQTSARQDQRGVSANARRPSAGGHGAALRLTTKPWAEVLLDGRSLGYTPRVNEIPLTPGRHQLLLKNPLCRPHLETLVVVDEELLVRAVELELLPARVTIAAPAGWLISVDGVQVGRAPLPRALQLSHGAHQLQSQSPRGQIVTRQLQAVAGKQLHIELTPTE